MATVNKDFKIKSGLIVEGTTATVNGYDVLTKKPADDNYIIDLIGGETLVKSVSNEFDVSVGGELSIDRATVDAYYDPAGAAGLAEIAANDYTDETITNLDLANTYDAKGAATTVQGNLDDHENASSGVHGVTGSVVGTTDTQDLSNKRFIDTTYFTDGVTVSNEGEIAVVSGSHEFKVQANVGPLGLKSYNDDIVLTPGSGKDVKWGSDIVATQSYVDGAVSDLVDSAPDLLNTLGELATALQENPDIISDLQDIAAGKQDTLTAGSNIDITGATISVTGLDSADISDFNSAALSATSAAYDTAGSAATAETNAIAHADALTTDDVAEGTTQYFTDTRAKASAADLLTGATLVNIAITGSGSGLTITAENGVAESDTDDLTEGTTNLYFTDSRALDAVSGSNIQPSSVDITWVRREEATWTAVPTASTATVHTFGTNEGSVKYLVRVISNNKSHVTEVLATTDSDNNVAVVEYGTIYTSVDPLATVTVVWNAGTSQYNLNVTTANNGSEVLVAATMLAYND